MTEEVKIRWRWRRDRAGGSDGGGDGERQRRRNLLIPALIGEEGVNNARELRFRWRRLFGQPLEMKTC